MNAFEKLHEFLRGGDVWPAVQLTDDPHCVVATFSDGSTAVLVWREDHWHFRDDPEDN